MDVVSTDDAKSPNEFLIPAAFHPFE
jgi:hypothetical protein